MNFTELESYRVTGVDQACSAGRWPASIRKLGTEQESDRPRARG
jgi:hypothetical protein